MAGMHLHGKTALITGAARRIGQAIALDLARQGMNLILHYRGSRKEAQETAEKAAAHGVKAYLIQADLRSLMEVRKLARQAFQRSPQIHVLINNASVFYKTPLGKVREKDWDELMDVNLRAPFFLSEAVGLRMVRQKQGKIINLTDWTAFRPREDYIPYCASKAGLVAVTLGLAKKLAPYVQVNGIAPGPILPPEGVASKDQPEVIRLTPLRRYGSPGDITAAIRFLIRETDFVTGIVLPVDGGNLAA